MKLPNYIKELDKGIRWMEKNGYTEPREFATGHKMFIMGYKAAMKYCQNKLDRAIKQKNNI